MKGKDNEYVLFKGKRCFNCGRSEFLVVGTISIPTPGRITLQKSCKNCNAAWEELYKLYGYKEETLSNGI